MNWKVIVAIATLLGCFAGGYYAGRGQKQVEIREVVKKGETIVKTVEKIRWKERIVQPDGTIIEREREEDRDVKSEDRETVKDKDTSIKPVASDYSLGVGYWAQLSSPISKQMNGSTDAIEIRAGRRIIGDFWMDAGYRLDNSVSLGVRAQF